MKGRMALGYLAVVGIFLLATYFGSEATTAIAERIPMQRNHVIVIDAGHGGEDGGAVSVTGEKESNINLAIALRLRDLMHLMGYQTKMIRDRDVSVYVSGDTLASKKVSDLRQRVKTVNETENAVFISIHQNTFHEEKYAGAHVFYAEDESAKALAESMQAAFGATINPGSVRSAKKAEGIYLMQHIQKPGILVECGFLSNFKEESLLRNKDYQQKICCVMAATLGQFLTDEMEIDIIKNRWNKRSID